MIVSIIMHQYFRSCGTTETLWYEESPVSPRHPGQDVCRTKMHIEQIDLSLAQYKHWCITYARSADIYSQRQNYAIHYEKLSSHTNNKKELILICAPQVAQISE